ncbi:energy-coupling factor transporter ATP-binding protein EcfA2 [Arthrobacter sp. CAN_A2]|uniref:GTPase n=1 Tax=Arthrobacter sp. CAN_A2 TaxID=2787718 RepID=UPI0018F05585
MSRSREDTTTGTETTLGEVLAHLQEAYELGVDRLPQEELERLHLTLERAGRRRSLSADHTVVGLFGPTGSGKSSLVNALSGTGAARVAVRRPTTSEPLALVWGRSGSDELLDWLEVRQRVALPEGAPLVGGGTVRGPLVLEAVSPGGVRTDASLDGRGGSGGGELHRGDDRQVSVTGSVEADDDSTAGTPDAGDTGVRRGFFRRRRRDRTPAARDESIQLAQPMAPDTAGLILLDLPDFDSTAEAHREIVERLAGQVDVLLWVVDPQKYADAALHHGFLRKLATHEAVILVALNQADRLDPQDLEAVSSSLAGILAGEGLPGVDVVPVSARTGQGVAELAGAIRELAESRAAATRRVAADAERAAGDLRPFVAERAAAPSAAARTALSVELGRAAGVPVVVDAVRSAYRRDVHATTGWPVTRWVAGLRPDPLRRLNLRRQDLAPELRRSSLPVGDPAQQARVGQALRVFGDAAAGGLGDPWRTSVRDAARNASTELTDALDAAVTGTDLETGRSRWWGIFGVLQWIGFAALVAGLAWLGLLAVLAFLQLPALEVPRVEGFPLPTLLILGGLAAGVLLGVIAAFLARWRAGRRAARVRRNLLAACSRVADDVVLQPVVEEVERCNAFSAAVRAASQGG